MRRVHVRIPLYLPDRLYQRLREMRENRNCRSEAAAGLVGDRDVEYTFIAAELPLGPGRALDFGCGPGLLSLLAAQRGYQVLAVDLESQRFPWNHPNVEFCRADLLEAELPLNHFDVILNCSAVEHVGLAARYGVVDPDPEGDLRAMCRMRTLLKPAGQMLLTIPCGRDAVFAPLHRVYGEERLPRLLKGFEIVKQQYWRKNGDYRWALVEREVALGFVATADYDRTINCRYALGCFVLRKPLESSSEKL